MKIHSIMKYIAGVVCLLMLIAAAATPVVRLAMTGDNFEEEKQLFEQAVQDDMQSLMPEFKIISEVTRFLPEDRAEINFHVLRKQKGAEKNDTEYTNAQIIAHVRNFCLDYLEKHRDSDLYKVLGSKAPDKDLNTRLTVYVSMEDEQYRSWENLNNLSFTNDYRSHVNATVWDETGRLFDKLTSPDMVITMNDLMNFTDVSQIYVKDIIAENGDGYDFSAFRNLKHLYLSELRESDTEKIAAIKSTLPQGCRFWVYDTPKRLKEVK